MFSVFVYGALNSSNVKSKLYSYLKKGWNYFLCNFYQMNIKKYDNILRFCHPPLVPYDRFNYQLISSVAFIITNSVLQQLLLHVMLLKYIEIYIMIKLKSASAGPRMLIMRCRRSWSCDSLWGSWSWGTSSAFLSWWRNLLLAGFLSQ